MIKKILASAVLLTTCTSSMAANDTTTTVNNYGPDSSMANREGKTFTLNATMFGVFHGASAQSLEVGYHVDKNNIITLQGTRLEGISTSENESLSNLDELREKHGRGNVVSIGLKHFVSNSFYVKPEIYSRNQEFVYNALVFSDGSVAALEDGSIEDFGIHIKIGNQWQWENFTLGCDWVGFRQSINSTRFGRVKNTERSGLSSLVNFYLGATF